MKKFFPEDITLRDGAYFLGWIGLTILIAALCWFLSGSLRSGIMINAVNRTNFYSREKINLEKLVPSKEIPANAARMGSWYTVRNSEGSKVLLFTVFAQGAFLPCMALVDRSGIVEEILPLNVHAESMLAKLPPGTVEIYKYRIEEALR